MRAQRRLKSACASAQSDQRLRCPLEGTLPHWLFKKCAQWRFWSDCANAVWSESSLGAYVRRYVFWWCGSFSASTLLAESGGITGWYFYFFPQKRVYKHFMQIFSLAQKKRAWHSTHIVFWKKKKKTKSVLNRRLQIVSSKLKFCMSTFTRWWPIWKNDTSIKYSLYNGWKLRFTERFLPIHYCKRSDFKLIIALL